MIGTWKEGTALKGITVNILVTFYGYYPTDFTATGKKVIGFAVRGWEGNDTIDLSGVELKAFRLATTLGFLVEITDDQGCDDITGSVINGVIYGGDVLEGDLDGGYNDAGDQAFFIDAFMDAGTQPHVETIYYP